MKWYWVCTCAKCGREIAAGDALELNFACAEWKYDKATKTWICDECAEEEGGAK